MEQTQFSFLLQAKGDELIYTSYFKAIFFLKVAMKTNSPLLHPVIAQLIQKATQASQIQSSPPMESNY